MHPYAHDLYSPLNAIIGDGVNDRPEYVPQWVHDPFDRRRIAAYRALAAIADNVRRYLRQTSDNDWRKWREYGDANLLLSTARSAALGRSQTITVPGSDVEGSPEAQTLAWLEQWADDEQLRLKHLEAEADCVSLGDTVYALGWDPARQRPRLRVYDPESYFPVFGEWEAARGATWTPVQADDDDYPTKVHIAYEQAGPNGPQLRRRTWQLVHTGSPRALPWNDQASDVTCLYSDGVWELKDAGKGASDLTDARASWRTTVDGDGAEVVLREHDLGVDFLPVVHQPNTRTKAHFGTGLLMHAAALLDDLSGAETDLVENAAVAGSTPINVRGNITPQVGPGAVNRLGEGETVEYVDTSKVLVALTGFVNHLDARLTRNIRISPALLGVTDGSNVPSGYALELSFSPTESLISEMRAVREPKDRLRLRMAARFAQLHGQLPAGRTPQPSLIRGPWLPTDLPAAIKAVTELLEAGAVSTLTAVRVLVAAGMQVDSAESEVERIEQESYKKARDLFEATGDDTAVRALLGLGAAPDGPTITLPPLDEETS